MSEWKDKFNTEGEVKINEDALDIHIHCENTDDHNKVVTQIMTINKYKDMWDRLTEMINESKCDQNSVNQDYYTGFISALSNVEGMMATIELDNE